MLVKLNQVVVYCFDMRRSVAFYKDQIGFPIKLQSAERTEFHSGLTTLVLHLAVRSTDAKRPSDEAEAGETRFSFAVLDLEQFYREKKAKGVEFRLPPTMQEPDSKLAVLLDPDGLTITVTEEKP
jgi:lactoylglutathione lyase